LYYGEQSELGERGTTSHHRYLAKSVTSKHRKGILNQNFRSASRTTKYLHACPIATIVTLELAIYEFGRDRLSLRQNKASIADLSAECDSWKSKCEATQKQTAGDASAFVGTKVEIAELQIKLDLATARRQGQK
jgi:hypothetical protein